MQRAAPRLSRVLASALVAFATSGAAAEPARIVSGDVFIKLPPGASATGEQIEIHSFSWGAANAAGPMKPVFVKSWSTSGDAGAAGEWIADVERPASNAPQPRRGTAIGGAIGGWANDGSEAAAATRGTGANQMKMDDTAGKEKARRGTSTVDANEKITIHGGRTEGDPDRPVIAGSVPNAEPLRSGAKLEVRVSKPQDKGSVWIRVSQPWAACRVGARYPAIELGDGKASYRLSDVVVTSCGAGGANLDYAKVTVCGWDPAKKEE